MNIAKDTAKRMLQNIEQQLQSLAAEQQSMNGNKGGQSQYRCGGKIKKRHMPDGGITGFPPTVKGGDPNHRMVLLPKEDQQYQDLQLNNDWVDAISKGTSMDQVNNTVVGKYNSNPLTMGQLNSMPEVVRNTWNSDFAMEHQKQRLGLPNTFQERNMQQSPSNVYQQSKIAKRNGNQVGYYTNGGRIKYDGGGRATKFQMPGTDDNDIATLQAAYRYQNNYPSDANAQAALQTIQGYYPKGQPTSMPQQPGPEVSSGPQTEYNNVPNYLKRQPYQALFDMRDHITDPGMHDPYFNMTTNWWDKTNPTATSPQKKVALPAGNSTPTTVPTTNSTSDRNPFPLGNLGGMNSHMDSNNNNWLKQYDVKTPGLQNASIQAQKGIRPGNSGSAMDWMGMLPGLFNLGAGLMSGKAQKLNPNAFQNPYEQQALAGMPSQYNIDPQLNEAKNAYANYIRNVNNQGNSRGERMANYGAGMNQYNQAVGGAYADKNNQENQMAMRKAMMMNEQGQQRAGVNLNVQNMNDQNAAAARNGRMAYLGNAASDFQKNYLVNKQMANQSESQNAYIRALMNMPHFKEWLGLDPNNLLGIQNNK